MPHYSPEFRWVDVPDPRKMAFAIKVRLQDFQLVWLPVVGATFNSTRWGLPANGDYVSLPDPALADYIYTGKQVDSSEQTYGYVTLYFGPNEVATLDDPYESVVEEVQVYWDPILQWIQFKRSEENFTNTFATPLGYIVPKWTVAWSMVPGGEYLTKVTTKKYFSALHCGDEFFGGETPIATQVAWDLPGNQRVIPRCLHPLVVVPKNLTYAYDTSLETYYNEPHFDPNDTQVEFPRTNFTSWDDYVRLNKVNVTEGFMYELTREEVEAPDAPRAAVEKQS